MGLLDDDVLFLLEDPFLSVPVSIGTDWLTRDLRGILTEGSVTVVDDERQEVQLTTITLAIATARLPKSTPIRVDEEVIADGRRFKVREIAPDGDGKITTLILVKA